MNNASKKSNKIKVRLPLNESIKLKDDGTIDWEALDPATRAKLSADLRDYFRNEAAEFGDAADDGEDLYDLQNDNYHNPHDDDENWDLNDSNEEFLDDFREIPDTYDPEDIHYESLNYRAPATLREYTYWNEYGDGYSKRYGDYDDEGDDLYEEDDFSDTDEYVDGLDFYGNDALENEDFYDEGEDFGVDDLPEEDTPKIGDSIIYPEDDDVEDSDFFENRESDRAWDESRLTESEGSISVKFVADALEDMLSEENFKKSSSIPVISADFEIEADPEYGDVSVLGLVTYQDGEWDMPYTCQAYFDVNTQKWSWSIHEGDWSGKGKGWGKFIEDMLEEGFLPRSADYEKYIKADPDYKGKYTESASRIEEARAQYDAAEVLMYFETKEDRDKAFSILLDHEEDVYKCDEHYTPAFPGSDKKKAVDRAIIIYAELFGKYDIVSKDNFGKDKAGEDVVVPVRHTKYVEMDEEVKDFVEDMESLLPVKVVDYEYRGVLEESLKESRRLREGGDIAYIFDEEGLKSSGIYDKLVEVYGQKIADIFLDWVKSPEYKDGRFVITYEYSPEDANIQPSDLMDFDVATYSADLFAEHKGIEGIRFNAYPPSFMSKSYMERALVKIENTPEDVRFMGKSGPMNHLNGNISMFEDDEL